MISNNKGLSTIVTTLILVLLVLVAVGILWNPVKNLLNENTKAFDKTKCLTVDFRTKVENASIYNPSANMNYKVTLTRSADGNNENVLVKLVFHNESTSFAVESPEQVWTELETWAVTVNNQPQNATMVEITPYFINEDTGEEQLCGTF
jgi:flagellin-like protein